MPRGYRQLLVMSPDPSSHLNRQVGGLLAFQDAGDVVGRLPVGIHRVGPIGQQTAVGDEIAKRIDRRQSVPGGK